MLIDIKGIRIVTGKWIEIHTDKGDILAPLDANATSFEMSEANIRDCLKKNTMPNNRDKQQGGVMPKNKDEFMQGFALAVGLLAKSNPTEALYVIREAGYTWQHFENSEIDEYDLENLEPVKELLLQEARP